LFSKGGVLDEKTQLIGFRNIQLIQDPLEGQEGTSFYFKVNFKPVFCGGSNWIPAENFLTEMSKEKYVLCNLFVFSLSSDGLVGTRNGWT
jgi:beta-mannosidase